MHRLENKYLNSPILSMYKKPNNKNYIISNINLLI